MLRVAPGARQWTGAGRLYASAPGGCLMRTSSTIAAVAGLAIGLGTAAPAFAAPHALRGTTSVSGPNALPAACQAKHSESLPQVAVPPDEPRRLSAIYFQDGVAAVVGASSSDGGVTWRRSPVADAVGCSGGPEERENVVNPLVAAG